MVAVLKASVGGPGAFDAAGFRDSRAPHLTGVGVLGQAAPFLCVCSCPSLPLAFPLPSPGLERETSLQ